VTSDDTPDAPAPHPPAPRPRPGASIFTIEGRSAPGLFVVGWLASLLGLGLVVVGALAPSGLFLYFLGPTLLTIGLIAGAGSQTIERRVRGEAYAGPSPYLVFGAMIAAVYAVGSVFGVALHLVLGSSAVPGYLVRLIGVALQAAVFIGVVRLTVVDGRALSWGEMGWRRPDASALRDLTSGAFLALPIIGLTSVVAAIVVQLFGVVPEAPLPATGVAIGLAVQLVAGAIIAPVAEEAVFRGFAITAWQRTVGARGAIVRASLLFALAHVLNVTADNTGQAIGLIVVGFTTRLPVAFALGWLFVVRRSIWAPLGLHIAFNAILLVIGELSVSGLG
jgi:membrane protease YdiL (CAAX protease family)